MYSTYNKGEWGETYAIIKLVSERRLHLGDYNLEKLKNYFFPILSIIKNEKDRQVSFSYENEIIIINNGNEVFREEISEFIRYSKVCFDAIKKGKGSFAIPEIEDFLNSFSVSVSKEKPGNKSDVIIEINDPNTYVSVPLGFSVKSQMGSPSTLVNASGPTNFTFKLLCENLSDEFIEKFNLIENFSDKFKLLELENIELEYSKMDNRIFRSNLESYGRDFDKILAQMLLLFYKNDVPKNNSVFKFLETITKNNPVNYDLEINSDRYFFLMRHFLYDYALGMRAGEIWKQNFQASGGYIIVKKDGEIVCYHFYFRNEFEIYLLQNTKFETPSTTRHKFGEIFKIDNHYYTKLNLQIRFTS